MKKIIVVEEIDDNEYEVRSEAYDLHLAAESEAEALDLLAEELRHLADRE